jgi:hypothetical protein
MPDFFRGWKRKLGCVVLLLACAFMAVYLRSCSVLDLLMFSAGRQSMVMFVSRDGAFTWVCWGLSFDEFPSWQTGPLSDTLDPAHCYDELTDAVGNKPPTSFCLGPISFWSIIIPLTLLSAWMLLSKPRKPKPIPPASEDLKP